MEALGARAIQIETLRLSLVDETDLVCSGALRSDTAHSLFNQHLEQLHARILTKKLSSFTVDVRGLDFVNSSAIRVFVNWISRAEVGRYKLIFKTDRTITWHRLSFSALQSLAPQTVEIVDVSAEKKPSVR